jgi:hypothetical protein
VRSNWWQHCHDTTTAPPKFVGGGVEKRGDPPSWGEGRVGKRGDPPSWGAGRWPCARPPKHPAPPRGPTSAAPPGDLRGQHRAAVLCQGMLCCEMPLPCHCSPAHKTQQRKAACSPVAASRLEDRMDLPGGTAASAPAPALPPAGALLASRRATSASSTASSCLMALAGMAAAAADDCCMSARVAGRPSRVSSAMACRSSWCICRQQEGSQGRAEAAWCICNGLRTEPVHLRAGGEGRIVGSSSCRSSGGGGGAVCRFVVVVLAEPSSHRGRDSRNSSTSRLQHPRSTARTSRSAAGAASAWLPRCSSGEGGGCTGPLLPGCACLGTPSGPGAVPGRTAGQGRVAGRGMGGGPGGRRRPWKARRAQTAGTAWPRVCMITSIRLKKTRRGSREKGMQGAGW